MSEEQEQKYLSKLKELHNTIVVAKRRITELEQKNKKLKESSEHWESQSDEYREWYNETCKELTDAKQKIHQAEEIVEEYFCLSDTLAAKMKTDFFRENFEKISLEQLESLLKN